MLSTMYLLGQLSFPFCILADLAVGMVDIGGNYLFILETGGNSL